MAELPSRMADADVPWLSAFSQRLLSLAEKNALNRKEEDIMPIYEKMVSLIVGGDVELKDLTVKMQFTLLDFLNGCPRTPLMMNAKLSRNRAAI